MNIEDYQNQKKDAEKRIEQLRIDWRYNKKNRTGIELQARCWKHIINSLQNKIDSELNKIGGGQKTLQI